MAEVANMSSSHTVGLERYKRGNLKFFTDLSSSHTVGWELSLGRKALRLGVRLHPTRWARNKEVLPCSFRKLTCHHPTRWAWNKTTIFSTCVLKPVIIPHGGLGTTIYGPTQCVKRMSSSHTVGSELPLPTLLWRVLLRHHPTRWAWNAPQ